MQKLSVLGSSISLKKFYILSHRLVDKVVKLIKNVYEKVFADHAVCRHGIFEVLCENLE
jgi:hypothetical protein